MTRPPGWRRTAPSPRSASCCASPSPLAARGLARLGPALAHPALRRAREIGRRSACGHRRRAHQPTVQCPGRVSEHQDPSAYSRRLRLPLRRRAHRPRAAQPRWSLSSTAREVIVTHGNGRRLVKGSLEFTAPRPRSTRTVMRTSTADPGSTSDRSPSGFSTGHCLCCRPPGGCDQSREADRARDLGAELSAARSVAGVEGSRTAKTGG